MVLNAMYVAAVMCVHVLEGGVLKHMAIFPGPFPAASRTSEFDPRFVNIGFLNISNVTGSSSVAIGGDGNYGDLFSHSKLNQGFGTVFGNANLMPANLNLVFDPDVADQIGPQLQNEVNF